MRAFLDANVLLWAIYQPDQLTSTIREIVTNPDNTRFVCEATQWELLNKVSRGRIPAAGSSVAAVVQRIRELQIEYVPILQDDTIAAATLPHHHSDPFDRILIAQCLRLSCPVLTSDEAFARYGVQVIW